MVDIARLRYEIDSSGARSASRDLDLMSASADKSAASQARLAAISKTLDAENRRSSGLFRAAEIANYGNELDNLRAKYNPLFNATRKQSEEILELNRSLKVGAISSAEFSNALSQINNKFEATLNSANSLSGGIQRVVATQSSINNSLGINSNGFKSRKDDIRAFGDELDRLRAKFDPIFAVSKAYEAELNELNQAHSVGAINSSQHGAALDALNSRYAGLTTSTGAAANQNKALENSVKGVNGQMRFLPVQLSQTVQQLIAGQPAYQVAIQQGNDINQALGGQGLRGTLSALGGAFVSLINPISLATIGIIAGGGALIQWAFSSDSAGESASDTRSEIDKLKDSAADYTSAAERSAISSADLAAEYGNLTVEARKLLEAQENLARESALRAFSSNFKDLNTLIPDLAANINLADERTRSFYEGINNSLISQFGEEIGVSAEKAALLTTELIGFGQAQSIEGQTKAARELRSSLIQVVGGIENANSETLEFIKKLDDTVEAGLDIQAVVLDIERDLSGATNEANNLGSALESAARSADSAIARARINLEFRDDDVGRAGALARQSIESEIGDISAADPIVRIGAQRQIDGIVDQTRAAAELESQLKAIRDAEREADREANKRSRTSLSNANRLAKRAEREAERFAEQRARNAQVISDLREENEILGLTGQARKDNLIILENEREIRSAIAQLGENASQSEIEAVRTEITERQRLNSLIEEQDRIQGEIKNGTSGFLNDFTSGIQNGKRALESFGDAAKNVLNSIISKINDELATSLADALSPSGGGGGGFGSFFSSIFGGGSSASPAASAAFATGSGGLFKNGGFTGNGGINDPAGIVHGQEFVINANATKQFRPMLEQMNAGGFKPSRQPANSNIANSKPQKVNVTVAVDKNGNLQAYVKETAQGEANSAVTEAAPRIISASEATAGRNLSNGKYDKGMQGRFGVKPVVRSAG